MANEFLPKIKEFKASWKEKKEKELTDDDIIAMLDQHLQREIVPEERVPDSDAENEDDRSANDETPEDDEIEQISSSLTKKLEELDQYVLEKKKEIDDKIKKIKRKTPPEGETSDDPLHNREFIKKNWFEVDI